MVKCKNQKLTPASPLPHPQKKEIHKLGPIDLKSKA
jgi:hypothetical protein